jgi:hypothetical protein
MMRRPKRLILEYDDGLTAVIDCRHMPTSFLDELSKLEPVFPHEDFQESSCHYVILRWKDGWQEVVGIDKTSVDLLRYYVLEREENVGRMIFEMKEYYPYLLRVDRLPQELEGLLIIGRKGATCYDLKRSEEVGELDHIDYDKAERHFMIAKNEKAKLRIKEIIDGLRRELEKKNLTVAEVLATDKVRQIKAYKELAMALGLHPMKKREDAYGLVQIMLERLVTSTD